jgi:hypothetical protein
MCDIELVTTNALAPDSDAVVRAFRRGSGHLTSLEFAPRSYRKINRRIQTVPLESRLGHLVATDGITHSDGKVMPIGHRGTGGLDDLEDAIASDLGMGSDAIRDLTGDFEDDIGPSDHDAIDLDTGNDFEPDLDWDLYEEPDPHNDPPEDYE